MNPIQFIEYYQKQNKNLKEDDKIFVDGRKGDEKIDFFDEYIKVFGNYNQDIYIDEYLGFIICYEDFFINKEFLEFCIEKGLKKEKAYYFYYHQVDELMEGKKGTYKDSYKTFK